MAETTGQLVVMSGPSGVGKTAIQSALLEQYECERSITATTRAPRDGERDGVDYYFKDEADFVRGIEAGEFLEHANVYGRRYGTPRAEVERRLDRGATVLLAIDVQGAKTLREDGFPAVFVFIEPPSWEELETRLRGRGTDDDDALEVRLQTAKAEMDARHEYDHQVVNDDLAAAISEVARRLGLRPKSPQS